MWPAIMIVFCYLVWQHLHLAWYSLILDWTIFHPEPALSPVVLTIQRRQSPKSVSISRKESTVSNLKGIVPKLFTSKNEILDAYSDVFDGIGCFPGPPYYIQVNPSVTPKQTPHQTRCYKWEFWSLFSKQHLGLIVLH